jgi:hypothetical protein
MRLYSQTFIKTKQNFAQYCTTKNKNVQMIWHKNKIVISATIMIYGNAASKLLAKQIAHNIQWHWNFPKAFIFIDNKKMNIEFKIRGIYNPNINARLVRQNRNLNNYFIRVENDLYTGVSLMDCINSNTGFFKVTNVGYKGASTEAHEFGHAIGLWPGTPDGHPTDIDQRGKGRPGIMYPRGSWVDPQYQYDPKIPAGQPGGTVHPDTRRVRQLDVELLFTNIAFGKGKTYAKMGGLSNKFHEEVFE